MVDYIDFCDDPSESDADADTEEFVPDANSSCAELEAFRKKCVSDADYLIERGNFEDAERATRMATLAQKMIVERTREHLDEEENQALYEIKWTEQMTDDFLERHIGPCPAVFPR